MSDDAKVQVGWWFCTKGHLFTFGDQDWHMGASQSSTEPIPMYCQEDLPNGDPCLDSMNLVGPFATEAEAKVDADVWVPRWAAEWADFMDRRRRADEIWRG